METPKLDALLEKADIFGNEAEQRKMIELFATHGPALVAALKAVTRSGHHAGCEWYSQLAQCTCGVNGAKQLLAQLEQEAA